MIVTITEYNTGLYYGNLELIYGKLFPRQRFNSTNYKIETIEDIKEIKGINCAATRVVLQFSNSFLLLLGFCCLLYSVVDFGIFCV